MVFVLVSGLGAIANAYDAKVSWKPVSNAAGYRVYVGYDSDLTGTPRDVGKPATDAGGMVRAVITGLPMGPTANFTVAAYTSTGTLGTKSTRLSLAYAVVARVVDSDGDGLLDSEEDLDLDRVLDSNETDSRVFDTDGDGVSDGLEKSLGSNPLLASSKPGCLTDCAQSLWIAGQKTSALSGNMKVDTRFAAGADNDPAANSLTATQVFANSTANSMNGGSTDFARYDVTLPTSGTWYLWARSYYPGVPGSNDANSFLVRVDSGTRRKLGNNTDKFRVWHWDGNGDLETGAGKPLTLGTLSAGAHKIYLEKREVQPTPPRVDVLVLTKSAAYVPTDTDALVGLANASLTSLVVFDEDPVDEPQGQATTTTSTTTMPLLCESDSDCDDGVSCTLDRCEDQACTNTPFDAFCDDGNYCNGIETCDPGDDCHAGKRLTCDDGLVCNGAEWCHPSFGCVEGNALVCDDGVACTIDACVEEAGGCRLYPFDMACNDGNGCTADRCTAEGCAYDPAASSCDDGLACTANDACAAGTCTGTDTCESGYVCDAEANACNPVEGDPDRDGLKAAEDPCPLEARNTCAGPVAVDASTGSPVRVNAHPGGASCSGTRVDCAGDTWLADYGSDGAGSGVDCSDEMPTSGGEGIGGLLGGSGECAVTGVERVFGCDNDATRDLFRCAHASGREPLVYRFAVADGRYVVNLFFVSREDDTRSSGTGGFDVTIEGRTERSDFDLSEVGGEWGRALVRSFVVEAKDGLEIALEPRGGEAQVSALEVLRVAD